LRAFKIYLESNTFITLFADLLLYQPDKMSQNRPEPARIKLLKSGGNYQRPLNN
jgi:hypothetical protein